MRRQNTQTLKNIHNHFVIIILILSRIVSKNFQNITTSFITLSNLLIFVKIKDAL